MGGDIPDPGVRICVLSPTWIRTMAPGGAPGAATNCRRAVERVAEGDDDGDDGVVEHAANTMAASVAPRGIAAR
jgi:hypothetical protein